MDTALQRHDKDGFRDRLIGMLEWLSERDPVTAARLVLEYGDDLRREMGSALAACDDPAACGCGCG